MRKAISLLGSKSQQRINKSLGVVLDSALDLKILKEIKKGSRVSKVGAKPLFKGKYNLSKVHLRNLEQNINEQ